MATVLEFEIESDAFPLGSVFADLPGVTVELERVVPRDTDIVPYFWVRGTDVNDIVEEFDDHPGVRDIQLVDDFDSQYLMRCQWVGDYAGILTGLSEAGVVLLDATGTDEEWTFEVRGDTQDAITEFHQYCSDHDISIKVTALSTLAPLETNGEMTDAQREALRLAFDRGYFATPRETTLTELADNLGISQQAISMRLRRGTRHLIAEMPPE